jgi:hypothetical protein
MYQIDVATAASVRPSATGAGTPGWFTDGDPGSSTPATVFPAEWANMLMAEILAVLTAASVTPSKATSNQLLTALQALFPSRPGHTYGANDWAWIDKKEGLIFQWGTATTNSSGVATITWPTAFQSACHFQSAIITGSNTILPWSTVMGTPGYYGTTALTCNAAGTGQVASLIYFAIGK